MRFCANFDDANDGLFLERVIKKAAIADLQARADMLAYAIAQNTGNIAALQEELDETNRNIAVLEADIEAIQKDLALKQYMITGSCPDGEAIRQVYPDGSVACEAVGTAGTLRSYRIYRSILVRPRSFGGLIQYCPTGVITGGGFYGYRESKAALNMFNKSLAIELRPEGFTCVVLHPGWVQTDMGGRNATLTPNESVTGMRSVIAGLSRADTGTFWNYAGEQLAW